MTPEFLYLLYLLAGLVIGGLSVWLFSKFYHAANQGAILEKNKQLENQLINQQADFQKLQQQSQSTFENLANRILDEKSTRFSLQNQQQIQGILQPLKERIKEFEENIDKKFLKTPRRNYP
ncbi:MAG: hypothetical protein IPJ40_07915 [Saprospirales bacterium]|nr:hypothetical protein [Saprospirales bacterium]